MLAIRMQRVGRKGHPEYRVVVQDAALSPTSGRVVARLGHYNPHTKATTLDKEKVAYYLENGAQPSERVVVLLTNEKVKLPDWVVKPRTDREAKLRNPEKLRRNQPEEPAAEEAPAEDAVAKSEDAPAEEKTEEPAAEPEAEKTEEKTEEPAAETEEKPAE